MKNFANANGKFCKRRISQIANLASGKYNIKNGQFCKWQILIIARLLMAIFENGRH